MAQAVVCRPFTTEFRLVRQAYRCNRKVDKITYKEIHDLCCSPDNIVCIAVFTLDAGLLAISQYSEGPATGHLDTGFSWFLCV